MPRKKRPRLDGGSDAALPPAKASTRGAHLVSLGLMPIKKEFLLRLPHTAAVNLPQTTSMGPKAQDRERTGKSLRALKLEKAAARVHDLCAHVSAMRVCPHGARCKRTHDVQAYLSAKPPSLPGSCPAVGGRCTFGMRCRFDHPAGGGEGGWNGQVSNDEAWKATKRLGKKLAEIRQLKTKQEEGGHLMPNQIQKIASEQALRDELALVGVKMAKIPAPCKDTELNSLSDSAQRRLAKNEYQLPRSERVLSAMGIELKCLSYAQKAQHLGHGAADGTQTKPHPRELGALNKKQIDFKDKLYVAPLTTVGNLPFRRVCVGMGADVTISEMAMASNLLKGDRKEWALLRRHSSERCFGIQVCGGFPDLMSRCAELLDDEALVSCDFVDVNMGCPIDGVCAKGAGSTLLTETGRLQQIVESMSAVMAKPLTIKVRMGYFDDASSYVAHEILPKARGWGAAAATLHGRTRQQRYSRLADWGYIERCAAACAAGTAPLPLLGNGDIYSWEDWQARMSSDDDDGGGRPKLATCMIGRVRCPTPAL